MCGLAHEFGNGAAQQCRLQPRNNGDSWALCAGSGEEPQTDVRTLPWAADSRTGFSQARRAPSPCFQPVLPFRSGCRLHGER